MQLMSNNNNYPTLFNESDFTEDDRAFLAEKELRIKTIVMQSAIEVGRELAEVRDRLAHNKRGGFEGWVEKRLGYSRDKAYQLIDVYETFTTVDNYQQLDISFNAHLQLAKAPDPQEAVDEALIRQELEEKITARVAKQIADYQRDIAIAQDEKRSAQERTAALDRQLLYVKQQLTQAQHAAEKPKIIEKEVTPRSIMEQIRTLEQRQQQLTRERDSYRKQLDEERSTSYARRMEQREGENSDRIRVKFAESTRDYLRSTSVFLSRLPSIVDSEAFESDDWHRLQEVQAAMQHLEKELEKFTHHATQGDIFIVDADQID